MIRRAREDEADALHAIYVAAARASAPHYTEAEARAWAPSEAVAPWWRERLSDGSTWVAFRGDTRVGLITLADSHLDLFFVVPGARGTGVAGRLYDTMIAEARRRGLRRLTTYASLFLHPILLAKGWTEVERQEVKRGDETLTRYAMHIDLQPKTRA